jgi:hypothetical protein
MKARKYHEHTPANASQHQILMLKKHSNNPQYLKPSQGLLTIKIIKTHLLWWREWLTMVQDG